MKLYIVQHKLHGADKLKRKNVKTYVIEIYFLCEGFNKMKYCGESLRYSTQHSIPLEVVGVYGVLDFYRVFCGIT